MGNPSTICQEIDGERLGRQLVAVRDCMADGQWRTLREISQATGAPEASASARLRELRHDGHTVERRRRGDPRAGIWEYWVAP